VKRTTFALAVLLVLSATGLWRIAQQPTPRQPRHRGSGASPPTLRPRRHRRPPRRPPRVEGSDKGDTAWMLTSSLLVLMMNGAGSRSLRRRMVRQKNALATLMHSFIIAALISVQWVSGLTVSPSGPTRPGSSAAWTGRAAGLGLSRSTLLQDHPAPGVHALPDDVRDHHAALITAPCERKRSSPPSCSSPSCGRRSSTIAGARVWGDGAGSNEGRARLRGGTVVTSRPGCRRWSARS